MEEHQKSGEGLGARELEESGAGGEPPRPSPCAGAGEGDEPPATLQRPARPVPAAPLPPARDEADEPATIETILDELTGGDLTRAKIYVIKRTPGKAPVKLPPLQIEEHMRGMEVSEILGESYGDGFYRWKVRVDGKFRRSGQESIAGYSDIPNEQLPVVAVPEEKEEEAEETEPLDVGELVQQTTRAVMAPVSQVLEGVQQSIATLATTLQSQQQSQAQATSARNSEELLLQFLTQQSQQSQQLMGSLLQAVIAAGKQKPAALPAPTGPSLDDHLGVVNKILGTFQQWGYGPPRIPEIPDYEGDESEPEGLAVLPQAGLPGGAGPTSRPTLLERLGEQLSGSLERVVGNLLKSAEGNLSGEALGELVAGKSEAGATPDPGSAAPAAPPQTSEAAVQLQAFEGLFQTIDQCVWHSVTMEEFSEHILPRINPRIVELLRTGQLTAADVGELSKFLGKAEITKRVQEPGFQAYLTQVLDLVKESAGE